MHIWFQSPQWGSNSKAIVSVPKSGRIAFQSPQWGSNSKEAESTAEVNAPNSFSPRNGEVILKCRIPIYKWDCIGFSPRNGEVILKLIILLSQNAYTLFQSPQWGSNSKGFNPSEFAKVNSFQSPQWGSNSKGHPLETA